MTRISTSAVEAIAKDVIDAAFAKEAAKFRDEEDGLFRRLLHAAWAKYPSAVRTYGSEPGLFPEHKQLSALTATGRIKISTEHPMPVPFYIRDDYERNVKVDETFAAEIADFAFRKKDYEDRRKYERAQVEAALRGFGTWAKLRDGWPEVLAHAERHAPEPAPVRALVSVEALNQRLGLPPEVRETVEA